jgi:SprT protein
MDLFKLQNKPIPKMTTSALVAKKIQEIIEKNVPTNAAQYCYQLWEEEPFSFKISRTRSSCLGNYIFRNGIHKITLNHDLNSYSFLVTYIHEIAHQRAWLENHSKRKKIEPHGIEWKRKFQELMKPLLNPTVFPETILQPLAYYMQNPRASSVSYAPLAEALRSFDKHTEQGISLSEVADNQWFEFRNMVFQKLELRRTRVLCFEKKSQRRYTILANARVKPVENS